MYIAIESTDEKLAKRVCELLKNATDELGIVVVRDAGDTGFSERIRRASDEDGNGAPSLAIVMAEYARRVESVSKRVIPALKRNKTVLSNGSWLSSYAKTDITDTDYKQIHELYANTLPLPDLVLYLDKSELNDIEKRQVNRCKKAMAVTVNHEYIDAEQGVEYVLLTVLNVIRRENAKRILAVPTQSRLMQNDKITINA